MSFESRAEAQKKFDKWMEDMNALHGKAEVIIGKQRHGPIGTIELAFEGEFTRFSNLAKDDQYSSLSSGFR